MHRLLLCVVLSSFVDLMQNTTIEERVSLLEIQVLEIQEDLTEVDEDVTLLEGDVNFLFDEQVIQDERLLNLEETSVEIDEEVESEFYFHIFLLNTIACFCCLFSFCLLCRFTSHNNRSRFPSNSFGRERRG